MTNEEKIDVLFQRIANTALQVTPIVFFTKTLAANCVVTLLPVGVVTNWIKQ